MIEEQGRVIALEPGAVWVETLRKTTCSGCVAKSGCGQGLMDQLGVRERRGRIRALSDLQLQVGDSVVVGIREEVLLRGAFLVYLLPLLMLFAAALGAAQLGLGEPYVIIAGLGGFIASWLFVRKRSQQTASNYLLQPIVLRATLTGSSVM